MSDTCDGRHVCDPPEWPQASSDRWACPGCGQGYVARRVEDMALGKIRESVLSRVAAGTLGWSSAPSD